jgi:hypothetical protein
VREIIELAKPDLVVRGRAHWEDPAALLANGATVLNVDSHVIVPQISCAAERPHNGTTSQQRGKGTE